MHRRALVLNDAALFRVEDAVDASDVVGDAPEPSAGVEAAADTASKDFRESMYVLILKG